MVTLDARLGQQFLSDLEDAMPGCDITLTVCDDGIVAKAVHRVTGRHAHFALSDDGGWIVWYPGSRTTGRSAYGFDSAVYHAYRHDLDFTAEHGPGTAWEYATEARRRHRAARAAS